MNDVYHDYTVDSEAEEEKENEELQAAAQRIIEETETAKETAEGKIAEETVQLRRSSRNKERVDYSELNQRGVRVVGAIRPVPSIVKKPGGEEKIVIKDQKIVFMAKKVKEKKGSIEPF